MRVEGLEGGSPGFQPWLSLTHCELSLLHPQRPHSENKEITQMVF